MKNFKSKLNAIFLILIACISFADSQIDKNQKRIEQIDKEVSQNNSKIKTNQNKITDAKKSQASIQKEINTLNANITKLQKEYNTLEQKYISILKAIGKNDAQINDAVKEIKDSNERITTTKIEYGNRIKSIDIFRRASEISQETKNVSAKKSKMAHDAKIILDLQVENIKNMEEYKKGVEIQKERVEDTKKKNQSEADKVKKAKNELESKKKELNTAKHKKDLAVAELKKLQNTLNKENKTIESKNKTLISEKTKLEAQIKAIIAAAQAAQKKAESEKTDTTVVSTVKGTGVLSMPIKGQVVVGYKQEKVPGLKSNGIEIKGTLGQAVSAADTGTVIFAGSLSNLGGVVIIDHKGIITVYGNLASVRVSKGAVVKKGQTIGTLGRDSTTKQPTLYFETRKGVNVVNPLSYL